MGFIKFIMKHGIGSPGSICKAMAQTYREIRQLGTYDNEKDVLRQLFLSRAATDSMVGPPKYNTDPYHVEKVIAQCPDFYSLTKYIIIAEHPELLGPSAPPNALRILDEVMSEVIQKQIPGLHRGLKLK